MRVFARVMMLCAAVGLTAVPAMVSADEKAAKSDAPKIETKDLDLESAKTVVPASWEKQTPKNNFRMVQFKVAKVEGDDADAEFYVSKLAGGGTVEDNIKRWVGQFADGKASETKKAERPKLTIYTTEITGTFIEKKFPMDTKGTARPGWKMLGAIAETPDGTLYIRLTGPGKTVDAAKAGFDLLIGKLAV